MTDHLKDIFEMQERLQIEHMGGSPRYMDTDEKIQFIKDMVLALTDELHEVLGEVGWKPWAKSKHINTEAVKGELIDSLHFFVNLCLAVDLTAESLHSRYITKNKINAKRQIENYDGVSTKCPSCKRALDDPAVTCFREVVRADGMNEPLSRVFCRVTGSWYTD